MLWDRLKTATSGIPTILNGRKTGWTLRRLLELGGGMGLIASLDPRTLDTIEKLASGDFENVSVLSAGLAASVVIGLVWNWFSTFKKPAA